MLDSAATDFHIENLVRLGVCYYPEITKLTEVITSAIVEDGELEIDTDEIETVDIDEGSVYLSTLGVRFLEICTVKRER